MVALEYIIIRVGLINLMNEIIKYFYYRLIYFSNVKCVSLDMMADPFVRLLSNYGTADKNNSLRVSTAILSTYPPVTRPFTRPIR